MKFKFQGFHPYLTYKNGCRYFVAPDGKSSFDGWSSISHPTNMSDDALDLWRLGKRAFNALGEIESREKFDDLYKSYLETIREIHLALGRRVVEDPNSIVFVNLDGESFFPDIDDMTDSAIVDITWQAARAQLDSGYSLRTMFLFVCLQEIDGAIIGMCLDGGYAVSGALAAAEAYANFQAIESGNDNLMKIRSEIAARNAMERYKRDPRQAAKKFIKECWEQWQENPARYRTQSAFASDALTKIDTDENGDPIVSFDTIVKKWIPSWARGRK